jgi:integrase
MACTGLRISEALGIESGDVDRERGTITVSRAWVFTPGRGYSLELPKTTSSRRVIAVPSIALPALERVPIRTRTGKLPGPGDLRTYLAALCALAGVPKLSPHGLRHVHAALAYHVTGDVYAVQKRMGHAQVSTTMNIYGFGMGADGAVRDGLNTLFKPPASS